MKISLDWLNEYVKVDLPLPELLERLTMVGLVTEKTEEVGGNVSSRSRPTPTGPIRSATSGSPGRSRR